jgi:hypothetical protein
MSFVQLNPQIPLQTPKGGGQAIGVIDYSEEHDLKWVVILDESGEIWTFANSAVRGFPNLSMGRKYFDPPWGSDGKSKSDAKTGD